MIFKPAEHDELKLKLGDLKKSKHRLRLNPNTLQL